MSHEVMFEDAANPTPEEMTAWAYARDARAPFDQDWDIIATRPDFGPLFLSFVVDQRCPNRRFFLGCLYLLAGDAVRTGFRTMPEESLLELTQEAASAGEAWAATWAARTRALVRAPGSFVYADWCEPSGLAGRPT